MLAAVEAHVQGNIEDREAGCAQQVSGVVAVLKNMSDICRVRLDLSLLGEEDYYNGIIFAGFVPINSMGKKATRQNRPMSPSHKPERKYTPITQATVNPIVNHMSFLINPLSFLHC